VKINEIFGSGLKKMAKDVVKSLTRRPDDDDIEVTTKDGKLISHSRELAALADATATAKKTTREPVRPTGKVPAHR